ncbi:MAG: DNA methyltransferase, partial [Candidatus Zixiibacteriota bacterium]
LNIDQESLGGILIPMQEYDLPSKALRKTLNQIGVKDKRRAREVLSFFVDLFESLKNLVPIVKWGGHICIVIGNRRVKQVTIPTDIIITELSQAIGLSHVRTFIRAISNKRMPRLNSPTNVEGMTETTMNEEYILVLRKDSL